MSENKEIHFHFEEVDFKLEDPKFEKKWIVDCIYKEQSDYQSLNFIFCSDRYLLDINQQYLAHDSLTDIITFNYNQKELISGDIFISLDRVRENATERNIELLNELRRVMIHGVLHLIGYDDKEPESQAKMRAQEDFCLTLHPSNKAGSST